MINNEIRSIIESLLFVASDKLSINDIHSIFVDQNIEINKKEIRHVLEQIQSEYLLKNSGIIIINIDDSYQLVSNPANNTYVEYITTKKRKKKLSLASLEVLSIIAYKQPITRIEIDELRGVNSEAVVSNLLDMGVIRESGRLDKIGRPILYSTTDIFLKEFGLESIKDLPKFDEFIESEDNNESSSE